MNQQHVVHTLQILIMVLHLYCKSIDKVQDCFVTYANGGLTNSNFRTKFVIGGAVYKVDYNKGKLWH
jgi:hypothetical protein